MFIQNGLSSVSCLLFPFTIRPAVLKSCSTGTLPGPNAKYTHAIAESSGRSPVFLSQKLRASPISDIPIYLLISARTGLSITVCTWLTSMASCMRKANFVFFAIGGAQGWSDFCEVVDCTGWNWLSTSSCIDEKMRSPYGDSYKFLYVSSRKSDDSFLDITMSLTLGSSAAEILTSLFIGTQHASPCALAPLSL